MIEPYNSDDSPSSLSSYESFKLRTGRRALDIDNLGNYAVNDVIEAGARRLRRNAIKGAAGTAFLTAGVLAASGVFYNGGDHNSDGTTQAQRREAVDSQVYLGGQNHNESMNSGQLPNGQVISVPTEQPK